MDTLPTTRVRALVILDGPNIQRGAGKQRVNYMELYNFFMSTFGPLLDLSICFPIFKHEENSKRVQLIDYLRWIGYRVETVITNNHKLGDVDALLAREVTRALLSNPDLEYLVIGSGDGDFIPLFELADEVSFNQNRQIQTGIISFRSNISSRLRDVVEVIEMDSFPEFLVSS